MSVSVGTTDAALVMQGGAALEKRMKDFQSAKKNADESLAALQLGRSAKDVYADAQRKQAAATRALMDANATAVEIVRAARSEADKMRAEAAEIRAKHEALRVDVENAHMLARRRMKDADDVAQRAEEVERQHMAQEARAKESEKKFNDLASRLRAAVKEVLG